MAAGTSPIFVTTPKAPSVRISTANTNRDGSTGTYGTLFTAGSNGSFFKVFRYQAQGTTTAGFIRMFVQAGGSGNFELKAELLVTAVTPSSTLTAVSGEWRPTDGIVLGAGDVVKVNTNVAETFSCWLEGGGDY